MPVDCQSKKSRKTTDFPPKIDDGPDSRKFSTWAHRYIDIYTK